MIILIIDNPDYDDSDSYDSIQQPLRLSILCCQ